LVRTATGRYAPLPDRQREGDCHVLAMFSFRALHGLVHMHCFHGGTGGSRHRQA
jgi:hypothetical protein